MSLTGIPWCCLLCDEEGKGFRSADVGTRTYIRPRRRLRAA